MTVALYVRVSTQEQAQEGYSIGEQTDRLRKYCAAKDWSVFRVYTELLGVLYDKGCGAEKILDSHVDCLVKNIDLRYSDLIGTFEPQTVIN